MAESKKTDVVNKKAKAHVAAGWEWFKEAAWLQVLLIVGVVVGIVISIPYIVSAIRSAIDGDNSGFYTAHNINYDRFEKYLDGSNKECNGLVGDNNKDEETYSSTKEGFVIMFYKDNCDNCNSMQKYVEDAYDQMNSTSAINGKLKFYTINVGWRPGDEDDSSTYEGKDPNLDYQNTNITLQQQMDLSESIKNVYLNQENENYINSSVTDTTLETPLNVINNGGTLPTPMFLTYTKEKTETSYDIAKPSKVVFGPEGSLSATSSTDMLKQLYDLYNIKIYYKTK
ncbi:MAG: hypothetical protein WCR67_03915 [Bacilli bacterium]